MPATFNWAIVVAVMPVATIASQTTAATGFDCAKATTNVERMICVQPGIARLDSELANAYPHRTS